MEHKELIPRLLEPPMQPVVETTTDCVTAPLPGVPNTLTAALWSENAQEKANVKEVSSVISNPGGRGEEWEKAAASEY